MLGSRRRLALVGVPVVVVLLAAFWWFRPDALVTDRTVDEELDPAVAAALAASPEPAPTTAVSPVPSPASASPSPVPIPPTASPSPSPSPVPNPPTASPSPDATSLETEPVVAAEPVNDPTTPAETAPDAEPDPEPTPDVPRVLARGNWVSLEHDTTGTVALVDDDGDLSLSLVDLDTSNGPDLRVILSPKPPAADDWYGYDDDAVELGRLKGNRGTQTYDVPDGLDVTTFASVVIWCERFSVGFGGAPLR